MANEIQVTATLQYTNSAQSIAQKILTLVAAQFSISGKNFNQGSATVSTSAAAIPLGALGSIGWCMFVNHDATNYVTLLTGTAGTVFARLLPGEAALLRIDASVTAPAWQAHTATCEVEFLMLEN
jgi:hypothetical protein